MRLLWRWALAVTLLGVPYALVMIAGWRWLYERGWLLWWAGIAVVFTILGRWLVLRFRPDPAQPPPETVQPSEAWPRAGTEAWSEVEAIATRLRGEERSWERPDDWFFALREVLETVARHYRPKSSAPMLDVSVPHVLKVVELVAADLRRATSANVPGAHVLTINDFRKLGKMARVGGRMYGPASRFYRAMRLGLNPSSAVFREIAAYFAGTMMTQSADEFKRWFLDYFVKKSGYYAIELYSGHLVLEEGELPEFVTQRARREIEAQAKRRQAVSEEPLRVLVVGQVKAGKSSVINAIFGETRTVADATVRTEGAESHYLQREGLDRAMILDTAGYDDVDRADRTFDSLRPQIEKSDLVLLVCRADSASRHSDRRLLDAVRTYFQENPDRIMPPVIVPLTNIDRLRPIKEWDPPYDIANPTEPKAENIAAAVQTVADDLQLPPQSVIPVCSEPSRYYNIDAGLIPAIFQALPEAERVKYLRCIRQQREEEHWQRLWQQAKGAGRVLYRAGKSVVGEMMTRSREKPEEK